jgi:2',3'-cyclic-nucleotide 2'-phosphodiesterase (5'-nucleotidase family)
LLLSYGIGGSVLGVRFKGAPAIDVLNHLQPDAVVIGNHEFDYGIY